MVTARGTQGREEEGLQDFGGEKKRRKEVVWKI